MGKPVPSNADTLSVDRRALMQGLLGGLALGALPALTGPARAASSEAFSRQVVLDQARQLAGKPFSPPAQIPRLLQDLSYQQYRGIRFHREAAVWGDAPTPFSIQLFAPGFLFKTGVDIFIVESGKARRLGISANSFETPGPEIATLLSKVGQFAGFRLHYPINRRDYADEFVVFQGASYFRAVSRDQVYGLSARGLAIDVGEATGEEFPIFRRFWIERPSSHDHAIVVHALLDSKRVTGAYRFGIYPGAPTVLDVEATLFPREPLDHVGLGALTSMFMHGAIDDPDRPDYRPAVHDSLGLAIHTGRDEWIWRPLNNPATLQISAFVDENPKGFGLIQRDRRFEQFQDLEAVYERRPSAWVAPKGQWGAGHVQLVEIPSDSEINDNIVAYWRPHQPLQPGKAHEFAYRLSWPNDAPLPQALAPVVRSAYGETLDSADHQFAIDYGAAPGLEAGDIDVAVSVSEGRLLEKLVQANPATGGIRVFLSFDPEDAPFSELRVQPFRKGSPVGETWLYRWTGG